MDYSDVGQEQQAPSFVNMDAERAVLGAALIDDDTALRLSALVDAGDYYSERHKWIHDAVCRLSASGVNVDMLTLADELQRTGKLDGVGGHYYLSQLDAPMSRNVEHYAAIIKRQAWLRKAIGSFTAVIQTAYNEQNPDIVFAMAQETLQALRLAPKKSHVMTWEDSFAETLNMLEGFERGEVERMRWPWRTWNEHIDPPEPGLVVELAADTGVGKCLARGTKIVMYDGTLKAVEDVVIGDQLMGPDSKPRTVKALGSGIDQMYWIRQNTGIDYRVNAYHILSLWEYERSCVNGKTVWTPHYTEKTVQELLDMPEWKVGHRFKGHKAAVEFPKKDLPLPPYFLGLWLGDGREINGQVFVADGEVIDYLKEYASTLDLDCRVEPDKEGGTVMKCCISNGRGGGIHRRGHVPGYVLGQMGLLHNKHIPHDYIATSTEDRLDLLAGLVDSDGHYYEKGNIFEITQKRRELAEQIKYLADTLGFSTSINAKMATIKERGIAVEVWRVVISGDIERIPTLIERKQARPRKMNKDWRKTGIRIEPDAVDEYFGFVIDGDGLFLLEDMTVTHNTIYAECMADFWAKNGVKVGFLHYELNHHIMLQRRLARWTGYPLRTIKAMTKPDEVMNRIMSTSERLDAWRGRVDYGHTAGLDIDQTALEMARMVELYSTEVFILDHAKKLHGQTSPRQMRLRMTRTEREGDNIAQFKTACETLGVCGIVLNHYNKSGKALGKEASRNDIAGSGEQSDLVNVIILIDREEAQANEYDPDSGELVTKIGQMSAVVRCKVAKQTMGPEGETFYQWMQAAQFAVVDREFTNGLDPDA